MKRPGERRLLDAIQRRKRPARTECPRPYDADWGWWIEQRLGRVESQIKWLLGIALTTLTTEIIRVLTTSWRP
jgi:hypothetical protein